MPPALQTVTFSKVSLTGGAFEAISPISGDSATFFNVPIGSAAFMGEVWATDNLHACEISITASRFHDQVFGIRSSVTSGATTAPINRAVCIQPIGIDQPIFPSDVLSVQANGTAADDVIVTVHLYYPDLPGIKARLATPAWVKANTKNLVGINTNLTPGDGVLGTTVALNVDNRLHANTDYALLGYTSNLAFGALLFQGVDTGNLRVGGPVLGIPEHDAMFFYDFAMSLGGGAYIPIVNSNNAGSFIIGGVGTDVGACVIDTYLAELSVPFTG